MTEELKKNISANQREMAGLLQGTDTQIAEIRTSLYQLRVSDRVSLDEDEQEDMEGAEVQLKEQQAAVELYQKLLSDLQKCTRR